MTKTVLLFLFVLKMLDICAQDSIAAKSKKILLQLGSGYSKYIAMDDIISPYINKGSKVPIWLKYIRAPILSNRFHVCTRIG
jgi:hypothetical protein